MKNPRTSAEPSKDGNGASSDAATLQVDRIAHARTLPLPAKGDIPAVPATYRSPTVEERRRNLRLLDSELIAETVVALQELAQKGAATLQAELGDAGKEVGDPAALATELSHVDDQIADAEALIEYLRTRRAIVASTAVRVMETVADEVNHRAKRTPALAKGYRKVLGVVEARNAKVAAGIESSKATRKAEAKTG